MERYHHTTKGHNSGGGEGGGYHHPDASVTPEPELPFDPDLTPIEVYKTLWDKFYEWERAECQAILNSLHAAVEPLSSTSLLDTFQGDHDWQVQGPDDPTPNSFTVEDFHTHVRSFSSSPLVIEVDAQLKPASRYTFCTPTSETIYAVVRGSDRCTDLVPYADDPTFDLDAFLAIYEKPFRWQWDLLDPDHQVIRLETARRLHFQYGLSFTEITCQIRGHGFPRLRINSTKGLITACSQRDLLSWPESQLSTLPQLTSKYTSELLDLHPPQIFEQVEKTSTNFCPNLNCLKFYSTECKLHSTSRCPLPIDNVLNKLTKIYLLRSGLGVPAIREKVPELVSKELRARRGEPPCSDLCFRRIDEDMRTPEAMSDLYWSDPKDLEFLKSLLKLDPDALPCYLSIICRKKCAEIFANRFRIYTDQEIEDNRIDEDLDDHEVQTMLRKPDYFHNMNEDAEHLPPFPRPCSHAGPCVAKICSCFDQQFQCNRNCQCSLKCHIRWKGCDCKLASHYTTNNNKKQKSCCTLKSKCPCVLATRECEPELCRGCNTRGAKLSKRRRLAHSYGICKNNSSQKQEYPEIVVKNAKWGQGAFTVKPISKGTIIGEYVGELEYGHNFDRVTEQEILHKHSGWNYSFTVNSEHIIESLRMGNETRFLNHDNKANCSSFLANVNGNQKILFKAERYIPAGKELFLDYGPKYWGQEVQTQTQTWTQNWDDYDEHEHESGPGMSESEMSEEF